MKRIDLDEKKTAVGAHRAPVGLLTNESERPMNVEGAPLFDWWMSADGHDEVQTAYQIRLYDGITGEQAWDSDKVSSGQQNCVRYAGAPLKQGYPYSWEVRTWNSADEASPFSARAEFATGLEDGHWGAKWIQGVKRREGSTLKLVLDGTGADGRAGVWAESCTKGAKLLDRGFDWSDYTVSLDVRVIEGSAGVALRAADEGYTGYMISLTPGDGLFVYAGDNQRYYQIASKEMNISLAQTYRLGAEVAEDGITVFIDGAYVLSVAHAVRRTGTVGLYTPEGAVARYANLTVTAPGGRVLLSEDFGGGADRWGTYAPLIEDNSYWYSRKQAALCAGKQVKVALAYVAGSQDYELSVNGARIGRAQTYDYLGETKYQGWDITEAVEGSSEVAVGILTSYFDGGQGRAVTKPGLLAKLVVYYTDGSSSEIVTDESWLTHETGYSNLAPRNSEGDEIECVDATRMLSGYSEIGYDDSAWEPVIVHGTHPTATFTAVEPEIGHVEEHRVPCVKVNVLPDGSTVADFGKVIPASVIIHFPDGKKGTRLTVQEGYELLPDGSINTDTSSTQSTNMTYVYVMKDGAQTFEAWGFLGFRYVSVPAEAGALTAEDFEAVIYHAEVVSGRESTLHTSDAMLDRVFDLMRRSALYSVQNQFVDTPTREKGQFLVDAINSSASTTAGSYERQATRKAILQFLDSADRHWSDPEVRGMYNAVYPNVEGCRGIPDFSLNLPLLVWRYYMLTADRGLLERAYPYMKSTADFVTKYTDEKTGLVTALPGGGRHRSYSQGIVDSPAGRFGYDWKGTVDGARTTVNALGVRDHALVSLMAEELGFSDDARLYAERASALRAAMNEALINSDGVYCDGLTPSGEQSPNASQHASSHAIVVGLPEGDDVGRVADYIASLGMKQGPMTADTLVDALFKAGRGEAAVRLMTNTEDYGWAKLINEGYTYTWENWQKGSQSHGWGSASLWQMIEYISGVKLVKAGAEVIRIAPAIGAVAEVRSHTVTARGPVDISYSGSGEDYAITIEIPANMTAEVVFPLIEGGAFVEREGRNGASRLTEDSQIVTVGSGRRSFAYEKNKPLS